MRISDVIEQFIKEVLDQSDGTIELQRNELAGKFGCVPSQINYVLDTRFTNERGYIVKSKRGGGGGITIQKITIQDGDTLMHIINTIGDAIDSQTTKAYIQNLYDYQVLTQKEANLILAASSQRILPGDKTLRDNLRAMILKSMLISLLS